MPNSADNQLLDLRERLQLALEAGGLGTWQTENLTRHIVIDDVMASLLGVELESFGGTFDDLLACVHPDDRDALRVRGPQVRERLEPFEIDYRIVRPDGTIRWLRGRGRAFVDDAGQTVGTVGCVGDVTAEKVADEAAALREAWNARNATDERLQRARLEFIDAINEVLLGAGDHRDLMRRVAAAAVPRLGDWCSIHFVAEDVNQPVVEVAHTNPAKLEWALRLQQRFPYDPNAVSGVPAVIRTGELEFIEELDADFVDEAIRSATSDASYEEVRAVIDELQLTSVVTVPLRTARGVIGALQFVSAESRRRYDRNDLALAQVTASRVATALETAWVHDQQRLISRTLQGALLPPSIPEPPGLDVAARYWATGASDVGGDFYDLFAIDDHTWGLVIGDVCGTGPEAAAVIGIARYTMRAAATHGMGPRDVAVWANDALNAGGRDRFCTVFFSKLQRGDDGYNLEAVAVGHPIPVLVRADGFVERPAVPGTLLGFMPSISVHPKVTELRPGDTLVLFTDGVTDVPPPHALNEADLERLIHSAATQGDDASSVADRIHGSLESILPIERRPDDIALLVVRVRGDSGTATAR